MSVAEAVGQDMLRMRVRGTLESIQSREGCTEPIARIVFVQLAIQAGSKFNLRLWKSRTQGLREAGEESLNLFLDGAWKRPKHSGKPRFVNGNRDWVLQLWEQACEEWNREAAKPQQLEIVEPDFTEAKQSDLLAAALRNGDWSIVRTVIRELREQQL